MARTKDIIVRRKDGLYVAKRGKGVLGFTNRANATHFTGKSKVREAFPTIDIYNVRYIDLNHKGKRE